MRSRWNLLSLAICLTAVSGTALAGSVMQADRALAKAVADRDEAAFRELLEEEAVFLGGSTPSRGPDEIVEGWSVFFDPSSGMTLEWEPSDAVVARSGELAVTTGGFVYHDAEGRSSKGNYLTLWRTDDKGHWRVVVDGTLRVRRGGDLPAHLSAEATLEAASGDLRAERGSAGGQSGGYFAVYLRDGDAWTLYGASHIELATEGE